MRLKIKLLLPVLLTVIAGVTIAITYLYINASDTIIYEIQECMEDEVRISVKYIDSWLDERTTDILAWSTQSIYREALTEKGYYGKSARKGAAERLVNLEKGYTYYDYIFVADPDGKIVFESLAEESSELNVADRTYFKESMKGKTWISKVIKSRKTGNKVFVISVPVYLNGQVVGVLAGSVNISEFLSLFIGNLNHEEGGFAFLAEKNGTVFFSSLKEHFVKNIAVYGDKMLLQHDGMTILKINGETKVSSFRKVDKTGWIFAEIRSLDKALVPIRKTRRYSIITAVITLFLIVVIVSTLYNNVIHTPLSETLKVIREVDKGNLNEQISVKTKSDEIGIFINAFNVMVNRLRQTLDNLTKEIEERKIIESDLEKHRDNLEELVGERTLALENEHYERKQLETRLHLAEKMEAIGTLAGGVAHDLNNILSGVISYPELILMDLPKESPLRPQIETIFNSGKRAAAIVQDLLTLARRGVSVVTLTNINSLVNEYIKSPEYEKMISFHPNVSVVTELEARLKKTPCSPVHLSSTIMNLVSNAAESMPEGGTIKIATKNIFIDTPIKGYDYVRPGEYTALIVTDDGIGIAPKDINRIYEPFFTKKVMGRSGTGLGMAVVWGTVKDHNGYVVCESEEGYGTSFTLYFPIDGQESEKNETGTLENNYTGNGERVLLVDDVLEQRKIGAAILQRIGYSVTTVSSGEEAIEYVKNHPVDIIVLDMIMEPGIDGYETYREITRFKPGQKAIIASGYSESEQIHKTLALGAGQFIGKPYSIDTIGKAMKDELMKD